MEEKYYILCVEKKHGNSYLRISEKTFNELNENFENILLNNDGRIFRLYEKTLGEFVFIKFEEFTTLVPFNEAELEWIRVVEGESVYDAVRTYEWEFVELRFTQLK